MTATKMARLSPLKLLVFGIFLSLISILSTITYFQTPATQRCRASRGCDRDFSRFNKVTRRSLPNHVIEGWNKLKDGVAPSHNGSTFLDEFNQRQLKELELEFRDEIDAIKASEKANLSPSPSQMFAQKIKTNFSNSISHLSLSSNETYVRNCITQNVIGRYSGITKKHLYKTFSANTSENAAERAGSFQKVFDQRAWGHSWDAQHKGLNASGMGATLHWTQETIAALHVTINLIKQQLGLTRIKLLDIPCGDMAWMSRFLQTRDDIDYTGWDIVPNLILNHKEKYKRYPWKFILGDIVTDPIPSSFHLILSRTLLQHLYDSDAATVLDKYSKSGSNYIFLTTWSRHSRNEDLEIASWNPGRMRRLNLEIPPINLSPPICLLRDGPPDAYEGWDHFLGLWKLPLEQVKGCKEPSEFNLWQTDLVIYSCTDWSIK